MVSQLLLDLPESEQYRIIFMERDLDEMIVSQEKMLKRMGRPAAPRDEIRTAFANHLGRLRDWLGRQPHIRILYVKYSDLIENALEQSLRISAFLDGKVDAQAMAKAVDPALYRNRKDARRRARATPDGRETGASIAARNHSNRHRLATVSTTGAEPGAPSAAPAVRYRGGNAAGSGSGFVVADRVLRGAILGPPGPGRIDVKSNGLPSILSNFSF